MNHLIGVLGNYKSVGRVQPVMPVISGLQIWLDGNDTSSMTITGTNTVTAWKDKSGSNNHTTSVVGTPTVSANGMVFNGSSRFFTSYTARPTTESIFVVFSVNQNNTRYSFVDSSVTGGRALHTVSGGLSLSSLQQVFFSEGGQEVIPITTGSSYIGESLTNSSSNKFYVNGTNTFNTTRTINFQGANASAITVIGGRHWGEFGLNGTISEMLIYNTVLSDTDRYSVEGYLAWKWGCQGSLPSIHPYKDSPILMAPTTPTNLTGSMITESAFTVSWMGGYQATSYTYTLNGVTTTPTTNNGTTSKSAVFSGLSPLTEHTVVVTAVNAVGSATSSSISVTTLIGLNMKTGLQLWLDGKDQYSMTITGTNTVTAWKDKSGLINNATAVGTPTISQTDGMVFNGSSYFNLPNGSIPFGDSSYSMYAVFSFSSIPSEHVVISGGTNTSFGGIFLRSSSSKFSYGWYGPYVQGTTTVSISSVTRYMANTTYLSGGNTGYGYFNGNTEPTFPIGNARVQPNTNNYIANSPFGIMAGTISEILVYNTSHTATQRQNVEGYLAWKWGIQTTLPSNHPYRNSAPA